MPVSWTIEPEGRFVVVMPTDPSTIDEWRTAMLAVLAAPISRPRLRMLIDRRKSATVSTEFVTEMIRFFAEQQKALSGSRRAIVVRDDAAFGMARMTQLMSRLDNADSTVRVFRDFDEAILWLTAG